MHGATMTQLTRFFAMWPLCTVAWLGCGQTPVRPGSAHPDSVYVETVKAGFWQHCVFDFATRMNRCTFVNSRGTILYDEQFRPYDDGPPVESRELVIVQGKHDKAITLQNGRLLLPSSEYDLVKRHIDWLLGKRNTY